MKDQTVSSATEYSIIETVGEGTTGTVYRAFKRDKAGHFQELVAIKSFRKDINIEGWQKEYSSLARVHSEYCVRVHSFEWLFDGPAISMEFVQGLALSEVLSSGRLGEEEIIEIAAQCVRGLHDLWKAGLFHGDLSPKNIMINDKGQVKLLDFGLGNYQAEVRYGTPFFTHPDVLKGEGPSKKMDIYALGQVLNWTSQRLNPANEKLHLLGKSIFENPSLENETLAELKESPDAKSNVSKILNELIENREKNKTQLTQEYIVKSEAMKYESSDKRDPKTLPKAKKMTQKSVFAILFTVIALFGFFQVNQSLNSESTKPVEKSLIQIRTKEWKQIWLDGKSIGFTPANLADLEPGPHVLKWVDAEGAGEVILTLEPGETKLLTDEDF